MQTKTDNRKVIIAGISAGIATVGLMVAVFGGLAADRQALAVSMEHLSVSAQQTKADVADIKLTLRMLTDQNATILVLQHQVIELQRRVDKVEGAR